MLQSTHRAFSDAHLFNHLTQFHFALSPQNLGPGKADGRVLGQQIVWTKPFPLVRSTTTATEAS